ncbi:AraC family transcriptional regulator [Chitinophaga horti]|uniref:AraC family transcriptional regulator n=1 Tax=Chitinophaga horti TaxID=2920382 RepID=A0ABY6J575_9BACT|nr:AraC family transcriptional regulator [Chitinophaga horti]UYQ94660.1 AraC family transcriptional regulator [Chitinophaga horti]
METKLHRTHEDGETNGVSWTVDGIEMGHSRSVFRKATSFTGKSDKDVVRLHFGLKGDYCFDYRQLNNSYDLVGSHHNLMYSQDFEITVHNKTLEVETFGVQFPREQFLRYTEKASDTLKRFAEQVAEGRNVMLSPHWGSISPAIQQVIDEVIYCKYGGDLKQMFLLSKSIELLALCGDAYDAAMQRGELFIKSKSDKEKIIAVRDLINDHVTCPPNLSQIARAVGLNEYKLKRGFREIFSTTVFGYLAEQRLHLARRYLQDTHKTAAEIAYELGYATPQHFSNMFRKRFGLTPNAVRNNP